jgi:hypothetical protein
MEQIAELRVNCDQNHVFTPLIPIELEIMALFGAITNTPAHHTFAHAWKKFVILDQI